MAIARVAESDAEVTRCFPLLAELRPHLVRDEFVERVRRQNRDAGYRLLYVEDEGEIQTVAGFRVAECLAWGRFLYVDDLVTRATERRKGHAGLVMERLLQHATAEGCDELHLDSGFQRLEAHRFYANKGLEQVGYHFSIRVRP